MQLQNYYCGGANQQNNKPRQLFTDNLQRRCKMRKNGKKNKKVTKKVVKTRKSKKFDEASFYQKYLWVVPGSVKEVKPGTKVDGVVAAHRRICQIKCVETGVLRTINTQDAFQVKYCEEVQARKARERAAERRKSK